MGQAPPGTTEVQPVKPNSKINEQAKWQSVILTTRGWLKINGDKYLATHRQGDGPGETPLISPGIVGGVGLKGRGSGIGIGFWEKGRVWGQRDFALIQDVV